MYMSHSLQASWAFYQQIRKGDPQAKAILNQMLANAKAGDPFALRGVRLLRAAMGLAGGRVVVGCDPSRTEQLRGMLVQATRGF